MRNGNHQPDKGCEVYPRKAVPTNPAAMSWKTEDRSGEMAHYVMSNIHGEADRFHAMLIACLYFAILGLLILFKGWA